MVELSPSATVKSSIPVDGNSRLYQGVLWQAGILIRRKRLQLVIPPPVERNQQKAKLQIFRANRGTFRRSGMTPSRLVLKAAFRYLAGFAFSMCTVLHGQTITGTWQGTLSAKESQRIVFKLALADNNGSLRGSLTFIDRGPSGPPLLSVTFAPRDLSVTVADISYRGKLSAVG